MHLHKDASPALQRLIFACPIVMCFVAAAQTAAPTPPNYPAPQEKSAVLKDFRFHTGEVMHELRMNYVTIGTPAGEPGLVRHGTAGSAQSMLTPAFAGEMFGPGQPLDAGKYFIVIPDSVGHGKSSKPSDGLRANFPKYNYEDMVDAQYRLMKEVLSIKRLRAVIGNSMGGMHTWIWGVKYPGEMDALVPMACQPSEMSSRNWILRRLITDSITNDPAWNGGNYTQQPRSAQFASVFFSFATSGGDQNLYRQAPTREKANALLDGRLNALFTADANDVLYQWASSGDYNPSGGLERIQAPVLAINAADDERNPPETGIMERELKRVENGKLYLIPASDQTAGHSTTGSAKWYSKQVADLLRSSPTR